MPDDDVCGVDACQQAPFNPELKFVIVKAVVFFCFWQGTLLGLMAYMGYVEVLVRLAGDRLD